MFVPRSVRGKKSSSGGTGSGVQVPKKSLKPIDVDINANEEVLFEENVSSEEDEPVISYSKLQRWPEEGEPVCIVCGRYGAYIVDKTDQDVCSLECKARHLCKKSLPLTSKPTAVSSECSASGVGAEPSSWWVYKEHPQVAGMTSAQVDILREKMRIRVEGSHIPKLITKFSQLNLPEKLMLNLQTAGYIDLTPVQMQVIPAAIGQRDLLVCAGTGSGKTLSFLLPIILHRLRELRHVAVGGAYEESSAHALFALILVPTRELAMQIEDQAKQLMRGLPYMRTALVVGGVPLAHQLHRLRSGVEVVIATPARLRNIVEHHLEEVELAHVQQLVLDEVDCLLHMGFQDQVCAIEEMLPSKRQNLMFSATIPTWVGRIAKAMMKEPLSVTVGEPGVPCVTVKHTVLWVEEISKKKKLLSFLQDNNYFNPPAIIFVSSKKGTLLLADTINKHCIAAATAVGLHGDMVQQRRTEIVREFLEGRHSLLVTTNVMARGVDLHTVRQVFVFDFPSSLLEFIHQVGRAGRMTAPGHAVTFINNTSKSLFLRFSELLNRLRVAVPPELSSSPYMALQRERELDTSTPPSKRRDIGKSALLKLIEERK